MYSEAIKSVTKVIFEVKSSETLKAHFSEQSCELTMIMIQTVFHALALHPTVTI